MTPEEFTLLFTPFTATGQKCGKIAFGDGIFDTVVFSKQLRWSCLGSDRTEGKTPYPIRFCGHLACQLDVRCLANVRAGKLARPLTGLITQNSGFYAIESHKNPSRYWRLNSNLFTVSTAIKVLEFNDIIV